MAHHIRLTNTAGTNLDFNPSSSPLSLTLSAQSSGTKFNYGSSFPNVASSLLEVDDGQPAVLTLVWPGGTDPEWYLTRVAGSTSYTSSIVGSSTRFTLDLPSVGSFTDWALASKAGDIHTHGLRIQRG